MSTIFEDLQENFAKETILPIRERVSLDIPPIEVLPSVKNSPTSVGAAKRMSLRRATHDEMAVFLAVAKVGDAGMTDDEIQVMLGMNSNTESARRRGLVLKHQLRDSGQRRLTRRGFPAIVWIVGESVPVKGAPLTKAPKRPSADELRKAAELLGGKSDALDRVKTWLLALAEQ